MIFFDVDNTLIDHNKSEAMAIIGLCTDFKIEEKNKDSLVSCWRDISKEFYNLYLIRKLSFSEQRIQRTRAFFSRYSLTHPVTHNSVNVTDMSDEEIEKISAMYLQYYEANWCIFMDVLPLLEALKKERLGIITNGQTEQQLKKLGSVGIRQYFDVVVTSHDAGASKPDKKLFQYAADKANVNIHDCIYIGDDLEFDAVGSMNAGMKAYWLCRSNNATKIPEGISLLTSLENFKPPHLQGFSNGPEFSRNIEKNLDISERL